MLDSEGELVIVATEVDGGVGPRVEFARSAQGLAGTDATRALAGVMHDEDGDREAAQAGRDRGDGDGDVEREKRLAGFWLAADDADRLVTPQAVDEPSPFGRTWIDVGGASDGE